ncbi:MAG TPA: prolyl oligopeptidase family serine peptidase [Solirubrobacteraceae bacterium]|nr:prolyl oligopeptidase family serine peptidase [Solirubrobacteraceae bacterium]
MTEKQVLPYGSWPTPITSSVVVARAITVAELRVDGEHLIWSEGRPAEAGRTALVRRGPGGSVEELLPDVYNARTAVHEYGGAGWWVRDGVVWFANWQDQRLYRRDPVSDSCDALTPEPELPRGDRYADGDVSPDGRWIVCVREQHPADGCGAADVRNEIVRLAADRTSTPEVIVTGPDFVSSPRLSVDGARLCWTEWDHPNMPWESTRLIVRDLGTGEEMRVAGGEEESISEPRWQADGSLTFISDRNGWWNLFRFSSGEGVRPVVEVEADIGVPQWGFGTSRYAVLDDGRIVFAISRDGTDGVGVRLSDGTIRALELPFTSVRRLLASGGSSVAIVASSMTAEATVARIEIGDSATPAVETIKPPRDLAALAVDARCISTPEAIDFPSADGRTAHALLYRPVSVTHRAPDGELPPLVVRVHGGPTGAARSELSLDFQYLTSRGFALVDVNYAGSAGYGRAYRQLLNGNWGVADVQDCMAIAGYLAERGEADPQRLCISGGSAGGYTTLACLARGETPFAAGADHFGVADLEALARDSHKFESRYLDHLIAPYPAERRLYRERSPIHHVDEFSRPLIVLQGLDDPIVPPEQAEMIVAALRAKKVPVAYVPFEGEQHGFRQAASVRRALEAELSFYAQVFGFELPADEGVEPVAVEWG